MFRLLCSCLLVLPFCLTAQPKKKSTSASLLRFMPNGASMQNLAVPTFNKLGEQTSLLKADKATVVDKNKGIIDFFKAKVEITDEIDPLFVHLDKGQYWRPKNLIVSDSPVKIFKSNFDMVGTGAYFDLTTQEVFIKGPSKIIYIEEEVALRMIQNLALLMAVPPALSTELSVKEKQQLAAAEAVKQPAHLNTELSVEETQELATAESAASDTAEVIRKETQKKNASDKVVSQKSNTSDKNLVKFVKKAGDEIVKNESPTPPAEPEESETPPEALVITNDGGTYFDAENNVLVFLQNVVAENAEMRLTCTKDLKVFMKPKNKDAKKEEEGIEGMGSLDMKELLATGDVKITYKQNGEKPPIITTGGSAFYKMEEEEILIKGGYPKVRQGKGSYVAQELGMWIKLSQRGAVWSKGKKKLVYVQE